MWTVISTVWKPSTKSGKKFTEMIVVCKERDHWVKGYDAFVVVVRSLTERARPPGMCGEGLSLH